MNTPGVRLGGDDDGTRSVLAAALRAELARRLLPISDDAPLDVIIDDPRPRRDGRPGLYLTTSADGIEVGPGILPAVNGCWQCSRSSASLLAAASSRPPSAHPAELVDAAVKLAVDEILALCAPPEDVARRARTLDRVLRVRADGQVKEVRWRPSSLCTSCGGLLRAQRTAYPAPVAPLTPRAHGTDDDNRDIDPRTVMNALGIAYELIPGDAVPGLIVVHAAALCRRTLHATLLPATTELVTSGRGPDEASAARGALFEVLERVLTDAVVPAPVVAARVGDAAPQAIPLDDWRSPLQGSHRPRAAPLDDNTMLDWVWGRRLGDDRPTLIPAQLAYHDAGHGNGSRVLLPGKGTSGRAIQTTAARATMAAMLEVIEHDAWFVSRFTRRVCRAVDVSGADDDITALAAAYDAAGYDVLVRDITQPDVAVCAVEAVLRARADPARLFVCGRAADVDPARAVRRALGEAWLVRSWERLRSGGVMPPERSALGPAHTRVERDVWDRTSGSVSLEALPRFSGADASALEDVLAQRPLLRDAVAFEHPLPGVVSQAGLHVVSVFIPTLHDEVVLPPRFLSARARGGLPVDALEFGPWNM
jgi:thiazole/oxazole-forming peptide maturase SagD family component